MLQYFIKKYTQPFLEPEPAGAGVRALRLHPSGAARHQGVAEAQARASVDIVPEPMAAAGGRGSSGQEARARMVLDIGGGTSRSRDFATASSTPRACASAAEQIHEAITKLCARNYGILIGEATAERIKLEIRFRLPGQAVREISSEGPQFVRRRARSFTLNSNENPRGAAKSPQGIVARSSKRSNKHRPSGRRCRRARHRGSPRGLVGDCR